MRIADLNIQMNSRFDFAKEFCEKFVIEDTTPDIIASVSDEQLKEELNNATENVSREYAECLCLYRSIAEQLPKFNRFVIHGATISYENEAFLFTAPSGTGKTTHITLWLKYIGQTVKMINGDKPIFKIDDTGVTAYGTPWGGKERWHKNRQMPLKSICIIEQAKENKLTEVNPYEHLTMLLHQIYIPKTQEGTSKTMELFGKLIAKVPIYQLDCDMSEQAVKVSFEGLTGKSYEERKLKNEN